MSSVQIVRTLTPNRFKILPLPEGETETIAEEMIEIEKMEKLKDGEKGIHEAYLRAIANAEDFIYLENQYFTSDTIGDALIEAMKAKPQLQVIMLLNIKPDLPLAPWKQRRLITRIRKAVPEPPEGQRPRFGVFTRWTHETTADIFPKAKKPRILSIYLHSKVAVVDNKWATIGSANLDGWSLDSSIISDIFRPFFGNQEQRAIEANALMFNGVDGLTSTDIVDKLRRRLWAEH
ncbi:MAG: hypothetical protein GWN00_36425, partial [Aliifodinibius sp.]|nr:hypothetical protein [Gammaproteobacteria bacterium]NIT61497.1 hypothetical protein [Fodinibius sp.]NIY30077.1 hypothetical protein [Fodinibius sp.]